MLMSEAFDLYKRDFIEFKTQSCRIIETHDRVKRTFIQILGDKPTNQVDLEDIAKWRREMSKNRCVNTLRNDLTRLRNVFKYLQLRDIPCIKPGLICIPKRVDTVPSFLTAEEVAKMIDNAYNIRNKFVISLLYSSGLRLSEFISLNIGQIVDRRFTVVGKGGKARLCFIDERTQALMERYLETRNDRSPALVVSNLHHERMTPTNVQLLIKNSAIRAGIKKPVTPHTLRHSFATNFLQNNGNIRYCQEMLGHASLQTTMQYTHVTNVALEEQYNMFHSF